MKLKRRKPEPAAVRIHIVNGKPSEPKQVKEFLDDEDCKEISLFMDATAKVLRELCKVRNLDYRAAARVIFELMHDEPEMWGVNND